MKVRREIYQDCYGEYRFDNKLPINIHLAGVTRPTPEYFANLNSAWHWLSCYQFEYVVSGTGYIQIDGVVTSVTAGDFFFINKEVPRYIYSDKENPLKKFFVVVDGEFFDAVIKAYKMDVPLIVCKMNVLDIFRSILRIAKNAEALTLTVSEEIGDQILKIIRLIHYENEEKKQFLEKTNIAKSIMLYLEKNYAQKFNYYDIEDALYLSKSMIIKHFRSFYNITPARYVQNKRIEVAKQYLKNTDRSILEISESVGFSESKYFSTAFKASTGMTPGAYRNTHKN